MPNKTDRTKININDNGFHMACKYHNFDIVEYLLKVNNYKISTDVITFNFNFNWMCENNDTRGAIFLSKLCSENLNMEYIYTCEINDKNIITEWKIKKKLQKKITTCETEECPICMENISDVITDCGHKLCYNCYEKINNKCHMCRNDIKTFFMMIS
jgi:hypothetical protein